jgi:Cdc6-like AAA superfamily ATPase
MMNNIEIKQDDFSSLLKKNILIIGKKGSGKTWMIKYIIDYLKEQSNNQCKNSKIYIFSGTDNHPFQNGVTGNLYKTTTTIVNSANHLNFMSEINKGQHIDNLTNNIFVYDDIIYNNIKNNIAFQELIINNKYKNITNIVTMQYSFGLSPMLRQQFNKVIAFNENFLSSRKKLYEHYFGAIPTFSQFSNIMNTYCANYNSIIVDQYIGNITCTMPIINYNIDNVGNNKKQISEDKKMKRFLKNLKKLENVSNKKICEPTEITIEI